MGEHIKPKQYRRQFVRALSLYNGKHIGAEYQEQDENKQTVSRVVNRTQTPLDRYYERGQITCDMHTAGHRLRSDYTVAGRQSSLTMSWDKPVGSSYGLGQPLTDRMMDAYNRVQQALGQLGRGLGNVVYNVCCLDQPAGATIGLAGLDEAGFTTRDGIGVLRMGLLQLVDVYKR